MTGPENVHTSNIMWTEWIVFMYSGTHTHAYITMVKEKRSLNLKASGRWGYTGRVEGGKGGGK